MKRLPAWLQVGGEIQGRSEVTTTHGFEPGFEDSYYLQRIRLRTSLLPKSWLRFTILLEDSRAFAMDDPEEDLAISNGVDVLHAYTELGQ